MAPGKRGRRGRSDGWRPGFGGSRWRLRMVYRARRCPSCGGVRSVARRVVVEVARRRPEGGWVVRSYRARIRPKDWRGSPWDGPRPERTCECARP